jgi:hypothetical protein
MTHESVHRQQKVPLVYTLCRSRAPGNTPAVANRALVKTIKLLSCMAQETRVFCHTADQETLKKT